MYETAKRKAQIGQTFVQIEKPRHAEKRRRAISNQIKSNGTKCNVNFKICFNAILIACDGKRFRDTFHSRRRSKYTNICIFRYFFKRSVSAFASYNFNTRRQSDCQMSISS